MASNMVRRDNYRIQADQAKARFLTYDQDTLIGKFALEHDPDYFYVNFLCRQYRIHRRTADIAWQDGSSWQDGNSYNEVMTLLDLLCDSWEDRCLAGHLQSMQTFGMGFHRNLLETKNSFAERIGKDPEGFCSACEALGGEKLSHCDLGYSVKLFDELPVAIRF